MRVFPEILPDKLPAEKVAVYMQLAPAIGEDVITEDPVFTSDPAGLVFSGETVLDNDRTAAAFVAGGEAGTNYVVTALCELASGETVQPAAILPVVEPAAEISDRRPQIL